MYCCVLACKGLDYPQRKAGARRRARETVPSGSNPPISYYSFVLYFLGFPIGFILVNYRVHANWVDLNKSAWLWLAKIDQLKSIGQ